MNMFELLVYFYGEPVLYGIGAAIGVFLIGASCGVALGAMLWKRNRGEHK